MHQVGADGIGQGLGAGQVVDAQKSVVRLGKVNAFALEGVGQDAVAVAVKLQAKRGPGGYAQVAQPQRLVQKIEAAVQALARVASQASLLPLALSCQGR